MSVLFECGFDWPRLIALVGYKLIQINFSYNLSGVKEVLGQTKYAGRQLQIKVSATKLAQITIFSTLSVKTIARCPTPAV